MHKRDDESGPMRASNEADRSVFHFCKVIADMPTPFELDAVNSAAWKLLGHLPNPFTGKVESFDEIIERRGK